MSGLQQNYERLVMMRNAAREKRQAIVDRVEREARAELSVSETQAVRKLAEQIDDFDERIGELASEIQRGGAGDPELHSMLSAVGSQQRNSSGRGNHVSPLQFGEDDLRRMHHAIRMRSTAQIEARRLDADELRAFSSPDAYLPPSLYPGIVGYVPHDNRILDRIRAIGCDAPSYEFIRHYSTTETDDETPGTAQVVAEGGLKPEVVPQTERVILPMEKIACNAATSWEAISDFQLWTSYLQAELTRIVIDAENLNLLAGAGGTGNIQGLQTVSGSLSYHVGGTGTTPTNETALDGLESAIAALRTGQALATADLLILHPTTWSAVRRSKDNYGRYLTQADPTQDQASSVWGVPVLQTAQVTPGDGVLLDTSKFGFAVIREPVFLRSGYSNDDFVHNLVRFVAEGRLNLAVTRPAAVCNVYGLPVS